jgi:cyanate permease
MALGFFAGSLVSTTILSPWLGGWRNVFLFFSFLSIIFIVPWLFTPTSPVDLQPENTKLQTTFSKSIGHVMKLKNMWLLGIGALGISGGIQGLLGYLPLYLRGLGWSGSSTSEVLASFHTASMLCVLPISLWSDRLGSRKKLAVGAAFLIAAGTGLLSIVRGGGIWGSVIMAGLVRDGFMALFLAMVIESRGVGHKYSGTATGFVMVLFGIGNLIAPPAGNSLAALGGGIPFLFWASMILMGGLLIALSKEGGTHTEMVSENER